MSEPIDEKAMEFLAFLYYSRDEKDKGYTPWCWLVLDQQIREYYIGEARKIVEEWWKSEEEKKQAREQL